MDVGASISRRCDLPPILPRFSLNETPKIAYFGVKSGTTCSLSDCHPHLFESPILQKLHYKVLNIDYLMSESDTYFFFTKTLLRRLCYLLRPRSGTLLCFSGVHYYASVGYITMLQAPSKPPPRGRDIPHLRGGGVRGGSE